MRLKYATRSCSSRTMACNSFTSEGSVSDGLSSGGLGGKGLGREKEKDNVLRNVEALFYTKSLPDAREKFRKH